ncbi:MAG: hypothetical protein KY468_00300 [Armatimonadetes bacterium]|nr:hypothetical protein [Armatimonadota bacterium]
MARYFNSTVRNGVSYETAAAWWLLAGALPFLGLGRLIGDPDLFWQLAAGRWMWEQGQIPRSDVFSFSASGHPWIDHSWLWQVMIWPLFSWGGYPVLLAMSTFIFLLIGGILVRTCRNRAVDLVAWLPPALAGLALMAPFANPRPQQLGLLFFALLLQILPSDDRPLRSRFGLLIGALFLFWANVHASVVLGLGYLLLWGLEGDLRRRMSSDENRGGFRRTLLIGGIASLLTPWGVRLWAYPFSTIHHPFSSHHIVEFLPPSKGME